MKLPNIVFPLFPFQTPAISFSSSFPTVHFHPEQPTSLVALRMLMCAVYLGSGWETDWTRRGLSVRKQKLVPGCERPQKARGCWRIFDYENPGVTHRSSAGVCGNDRPEVGGGTGAGSAVCSTSARTSVRVMLEM